MYGMVMHVALCNIPEHPSLCTNILGCQSELRSRNKTKRMDVNRSDDAVSLHHVEVKSRRDATPHGATFFAAMFASCGGVCGNLVA